MNSDRVMSRDPWTRATGLGVTAALLLSAAPSGGPAATAITREAEQTWETGIVERVSDGDTIRVTIVAATNPEMYAPRSGTTYCRNRVQADGTLPAEGLRGCKVRLIAVQAPETAGHGNTDLPQCGAREAEDALARALPRGTTVQLRSINVGSGDPRYSGGRLARSVYAPNGAGGWVDVARSLYRQGLVMWFPFNVGDTEKAEYAHNLEYRRLADRAATAGRGLWSDSFCGSSTPASVRMWVVSDPPGTADAGETVVIRNEAEAAVDVSGWTLRDSSLTWAQLPLGTVIEPGDYINVHTGEGTAGSPTPRDHYMNRAKHVFANFDAEDDYFYGDAAYLYDVQPGLDYGNLRAWYHYPCDPDDCWDPLVGRVTVSAVRANPPGADKARREYVRIRNHTRGAVSLGGYELRWNGDSYVFPATASVRANGSLRIVMGRGKDTRRRLHVGSRRPALRNAGGAVVLRNLRASIVDCRSWRDGACPAGVPQSAVGRRKSTARVRVSKVPTAPRGIAATLVGDRVEVTWSPPDWPGVAPVKKYRARVYRWVSGTHVRTATCTSGGATHTCTADAVERGGGGLFVRVAARNKHGYGATSTYVPVSQKQQGT